MTTGQTPPGAGVIVVRQFSDEIKVLALTTARGETDIPKGGLEPGEFPLEAALRETQEEAGITDLSFDWGFVHTVTGELTCYVAKTMQDPVILKNPHTGIIEHVRAQWVSWDEMLVNPIHYLVPCIEWARKIVQSTP